MKRRMFLAGAATAAGRARAAADRIALGVIGSGGRGTWVMGVFQEQPGVQVGAICDVYEPNLERALSAAAKAQGAAPKAVRNYKELLGDKSIDAVLIATPEHWHHRMVLDALSAGKDVYVEKPLCHTPQEGVELVEAEKRSKNIVQVGMQRRSYDLFIEARKVVAAGTLGDVRMIRSWWLNNSLGRSQARKIEGHLDWEQWQGPAPRRPLDPRRFRAWRFFDDYAGGIVTDQGAHVFDGIHMLMEAGYPEAVTAAAGRPHMEGVETPESVVVAAQYRQDFLAVFTINYAAMKYRRQNDQLNHLDGDKARMDIAREEYKVFREGAETTPIFSMKSERGFDYATTLHVRNFLDCMRTRKTCTAPMSLGFQAALVVQMATLSLKSGKRVHWDAAAGKVLM